jgi:small-conductance mechanosensitive channel
MFTQILQSPNLQIEILGNSVYEWLIAVVVFVLVVAGLKIFQAVVVAKLKKITKKTKTEIDDIVINAIHAIHWPFYVLVALYAALHFVDTVEAVNRWSYYIILIAVVYYAVKAAQEFVDVGAKKIIQKRKKEEAREHDTEIIRVLSSVIKFSLWIVAALLLLSNLGYNITSLIAGLGIGGLAVALALQNVLGDLFSAISIYFDKPFKVGDFIIIGNYMGVVKKIGMKTTRIQTLQGEELVVSNNELTATKIQNFGRMERRRIVFSVGVTYDTPYEKLKKIPDMIKDIIGNQKMAEVDRVHFKSFGDSSLNYEIVYYVNVPDYNAYMDIQQTINLDIVKKFETEKIEIAYPTRTVYVKK